MSQKSAVNLSTFFRDTCVWRVTIDMADVVGGEDCVLTTKQLRKFVKFGADKLRARVVYRWSDVQAWLGLGQIRLAVLRSFSQRKRPLMGDQRPFHLTLAVGHKKTSGIESVRPVNTLWNSLVQVTLASMIQGGY